MPYICAAHQALRQIDLEDIFETLLVAAQDDRGPNLMSQHILKLFHKYICQIFQMCQESQLNVKDTEEN